MDQSKDSSNGSRPAHGTNLGYLEQDQPDHHRVISDLSTVRIIWAVIINIGITVTELIAGLLTGSLALLSDAAHNFSDVVVLGITYTGARLAGQKPRMRHTFGMGRAEVLAGLINAVALIGVTLFILYEAYVRILNPQRISSGLMLGVGFVGLLGNIASVLVLTFKKKKESFSLNLKSAILHLLLDALSAMGVMIAALVIMFTGWVYADPIAGILIGVLVLAGASRLLWEALEILMEKAPANISIDRITKSLLSIDGVCEVHDLHVWSISSTTFMMTAHFVMSPESSRSTEEVIIEARKLLAEKHAIRHCTLQPEKTKCHGTGGDNHNRA